MLNEDGYNVFIVDLPYGVHGFNRYNEDASYSILLNARDTYERRKQAYMHEVEHIRRDDIREADIQKIEAERHGM